MATSSNKKEDKPGAVSSKKNSEFKTKVFSKSDHPATARETVKLVLNLFVNFFS